MFVCAMKTMPIEPDSQVSITLHHTVNDQGSNIDKQFGPMYCVPLAWAHGAV